MLICPSITQILRHIYSIVDGNSYAIYEKMLTLVELHRIQKKSSVKNNNGHRQDFNVYIKQYNTETGYLRLTLDSTRSESERKAIKFFSQEKKATGHV